MKKAINIMAKTLNAAILLGMTATGALYYQDVSAKEYVNSISAEEKYCLQQNIFFEARNQSTLGQVAVAWVTLNRVESSRYPDSICEVVWQKSAFSWTVDGLSDKPSDNILEQNAWKLAEDLAEETLKNWVVGQKDPTLGANHYHAHYVNPYWANGDYKTVSIDDHIFYDLSW